MQPWLWVLLILVVVAVAAVVLMRQRRTTTLRDRFGPEYDRTVESADDRRGAEQQLLDRAKRRDRLDIRPLPEAARARYAEQWRSIQERFIDDPAGSVGSAHSLLDQVMAERGYPTKDFEEQADLVSVDHPRVVEDYRAAYSVYRRQGSGEATTEDLRDALVRYRSLFEDLLRPEGGTSNRADDRRADRIDDGLDGRTDDRYDTRVDDRLDDRLDDRFDGSRDGSRDGRADGVPETREDLGRSSRTYGDQP